MTDLPPEIEDELAEMATAITEDPPPEVVVPAGNPDEVEVPDEVPEKASATPDASEPADSDTPAEDPPASLSEPEGNISTESEVETQSEAERSEASAQDDEVNALREALDAALGVQDEAEKAFHAAQEVARAVARELLEVDTTKHSTALGSPTEPGRCPNCEFRSYDPNHKDELLEQHMATHS